MTTQSGNPPKVSTISAPVPPSQQQPRRTYRIIVEAIDPFTGNVVRKGIAEIPGQFGPALRSAIDEIRGEIGGRLEGMFLFKKEQSLTNAAVGLAKTAAAVNQAVPAADEHYPTTHPTSLAQEQSLRDAAVGINSLGHVIDAVIPVADPHYN